MSDTSRLLKEGLSDAIGFVGGALAAFWIARALGFDLFAEGYGSGSIGAVIAVGLGGGLGLQIARRWRAANAAKD
ncbi:hypothetical protein [Hydrogenophaga sp. RWCD_12]|uniref:hypothetical protein n=1 Tax=Hydrogenophaga sp. RWCD_12 TaxID=3391190 RepID=UPI0039846433